MPSVRSYFNVTLYRKHLLRYWPIWTVYALMWFFYLPANLILNGGASNPEFAQRFAQRTVLSSLPTYGMGLAAVFGLFAAMAIWSYMYNNRPVGFLHALPIRREGLFFTGMAAGVTFFVGPNLVIFLMTLAAEAAAGTVYLPVLLLWLAVQTLLCLFYFCFATLCGFVTGHILVAPAFYVIFNFLTMGLLALVENALRSFVYGFDGLTAAWPVAQWLSPMYQIASTLTYRTIYNENNVVADYRLEGVPTLAVYAVIGLLLVVVALLLYRRQQLERAGEVVTVGWMRPLFKYGVAFCGALAFGTMTFAIFSGSLSDSAWAMLVFMLVWGFLSYLAAEMLLQKSFRVLKKSWKGCVAFLAVLVVLTAAMELDFTGYERRVPEASQVESVTVSNLYTPPYDSARRGGLTLEDERLVEQVVSLHQATVDRKTEIEALTSDYSFINGTTKIADGVFADETNTVSFDLSYTLKDGGTLNRSYSIPVSVELLADPTSPAAMIEALLNGRGDVSGDYFPETVTAEDFISGYVAFNYNERYGSYQEVGLTAAQAGRLYEAAMEDFAAGNLGRRYLMDGLDYRTQVYANEISLTFYGIFPGWTDEDEAGTAQVSFYPQTDSANLIAALEELGVLSGSRRLTTWLEQAQTAAK